MTPARPQPGASRKAEIATGLVILLAPALFVVAAEGVAAVADRGRGTGFEGPAPSAIQALFHTVDGMGRARPLARSAHVSINAMGFRGPDLAVPKPAETLRIAFLGDSRTFDWLAASEAETWPARTAAALAARFPACRVDYVNASGPLYGTAELARLVQEVRPLGADMAVVMAGDLGRDSASLARGGGLAINEGRSEMLARIWPLWSRIERFMGLMFLNSVGRLFDAASGRRDALWLAEVSRRFAALLDALGATVPTVAVVQSGVPTEQVVRPVGFAALNLPWKTVQRLGQAQARAVRDEAARHGALVVDSDRVIPLDRAHFDNALHLREPARAALSALLADTLAPRVPERCR